jgi:hypothetical protein
LKGRVNSFVEASVSAEPTTPVYPESKALCFSPLEILSLRGRESRNGMTFIKGK